MIYTAKTLFFLCYSQLGVKQFFNHGNGRLFISFRILGLVIYNKNITCLLLRNTLDELELGILKIHNLSIVIDSSGRFKDYHIVKTQTIYLL